MPANPMKRRKQVAPAADKVPTVAEQQGSSSGVGQSGNPPEEGKFSFSTDTHNLEQMFNVDHPVMQRVIVFFLYVEGVNFQDIARRLKVVYNETAMSRTSISRWCKMFAQGRRSILDSQRPGRPSNEVRDVTLHERFDEFVSDLDGAIPTAKEVMRAVGVSRVYAMKLLHQRFGSAYTDTHKTKKIVRPGAEDIQAKASTSSAPQTPKKKKIRRGISMLDCDICRLRFRDKGSFKAHVINVHIGRHGKRQKGAGRKPLSTELEEKLYAKVLDMRRQHFKVSRRLLTAMAKEIWASMEQKDNKVFQASKGWMDNFFKRYKLSSRRRTTTGQFLPKNVAEKCAKFVMYVRHLQRNNDYPLSQIFGADEVAVWPDEPDSTTVEVKGAKMVPIASTGHEKMRLTVMFTARADGRKLPPFVLLPLKRQKPELAAFSRELKLCYLGTNWMNDDTTEKYLDEVIGASIFKQKRLLCWDSFKAHISEKTKSKLQQLAIHTAVIPGGCTSVVQPADVCWNKPFKDRFNQLKNEWFTLVAAKANLTKGGKPAPPPYVEVLRWISEGWKAVPNELIRSSFISCGITTALDGSQDDQITMFKPGKKCEMGRAVLDKLMSDSVILNELRLENEDGGIVTVNVVM